MRNEVRNMDASVKARLKNIAKEYKKTFNLILGKETGDGSLFHIKKKVYYG